MTCYCDGAFCKFEERNLFPNSQVVRLGWGACGSILGVGSWLISIQGSDLNQPFLSSQASCGEAVFMTTGPFLPPPSSPWDGMLTSFPRGWERVTTE